VKAHAKNHLKTAGRTERGLFFRELMMPILDGFLSFPKSVAGIKKLFVGLPNPRLKNLDTRVPILDTQFLA
jgi:hypothetical protein